MTEEYDPLLEDLIERLRARRVSLYGHSPGETPTTIGLQPDRLCTEAADALQAQADARRTP